jgi:transcriptional regulator GlxA family with amidase domain
MAPLNIGVLVVPPIQLLDIAPIDLFAMMTTEYFKACNMPQPLLDLAIPTSDLKITYISASGPSSTAETTAYLGLAINAKLDDPTVAPGKLDILMIPGPPPGMVVEEPVLAFVRAHVQSGVDLLTICSGVFVAAQAGVLDGKHATGTRGVADMLARDYPAVKWEDKRYWNDGRIWTSGTYHSCQLKSQGGADCLL